MKKLFVFWTLLYRWYNKVQLQYFCYCLKTASVEGMDADKPEEVTEIIKQEVIEEGDSDKRTTREAAKTARDAAAAKVCTVISEFLYI